MKPRLRGVSHHFALFAALGAGAVLVGMARSGRAALAGAVYSASLALMFGISALYHRHHWQPPAYLWMKRADHACIFLLIAGTYTPFCLLALPPDDGRRLLAIIWSGAAAGVVQTLLWIRAPKAVTALLYVGLGWVLLPYVPLVRVAIGLVGLAVVLGGGVFYTAGAAMYALKRPDPVPGVFGYHEVFHACVIAASVCHFAIVVLLVRGAG